MQIVFCDKLAANNGKATRHCESAAWLYLGLM